MEAAPNLGSLIAGCWLLFGSALFWIGVLWPGYQRHWGRRGCGYPMSLLGEILCGSTLTLLGAEAVADAYHQIWPARVLPVLCVLFLSTLATALYDSRKHRR
jgi:hypothetical protein